ncbi:ribosome biogenesis GTP-binding protein YihA/YsxC [Buchnera aphidicola]|uniref:ribosome biogenesis GTP-binding protein YihA/YsxC n=1 Tax=Buchnera aphidicola TaxID=9 RepID=UPI0031B869D4
MNLKYQSIQFLTSFADVKYINITDIGIEVACIGYSNVGKSTLINCLARNNKLSRFSKYPGRTKLINFFMIDKNFRLVDLPGYGYSKFCKCEIKNFNLVVRYIKYRKCLKIVILVIDIRRLLRPFDVKMLFLLKLYNIQCIVLLNKCDKLNTLYQKKKIHLLNKEINSINPFSFSILFSSFKKVGLHILYNYIDNIIFK